jgi:GTP-binding protein
VSSRRLPSVVLVGRPNVGKSTLFNRLTGKRRAIVTAIPGTTRDVLTYPVVWEDHGFELTDTGGMFGASADPLHQLVFERGQRAIASADAIVFVVDGREGLVPGDEDIAAAIRAANVPAILAVNKTDDRRAKAGALELYRLGFDPILEVSAEHGQGMNCSTRSSGDCLVRRGRAGRSASRTRTTTTQGAARAPPRRKRPRSRLSAAPTPVSRRW